MRMKMKVLLSLLLVFLVTTGETCINDGFLVAVNVPIVQRLAIRSGPDLSFSSDTTVHPKDYIDPSYLSQIQNVRVYDVRVYVEGTYNGRVNNGVARVNNVTLITFAGEWANFKTPQSLTNGSSYIVPNPAGVTTFLAALNNFKANPQTATVRVGGSGVLSGQSPVPAGLSIVIEIWGQLDAQVK